MNRENRVSLKEPQNNQAHPLSLFAPRTRVYIESKRYLVKIADSLGEIFQALKLRHQIFYEEMNGIPSSTGIDMDEFDYDSDHLILIDKSSQRVVGTYRLRHSRNVEKFYSGTEFQLQYFLKKNNEPILELGRACLHPDFRNGIVIHQLWMGITSYINQTQSRILIGCSTVKTTHFEEVFSIYQTLKKNGVLIHQDEIQPLHADTSFEQCSTLHHWPEDGVNLPPLLDFYIKVGAKIIGEPAYDRDFKCYDFFTVLRIADVPPRIAEKFGLQPAV